MGNKHGMALVDESEDSTIAQAAKRLQPDRQPLLLRAWSPSFPLDNLTQLILYDNWFTLLNPESPSTHKRHGL